ncbi:MAG: 1-(5-phosphoribosyl)-5-[(5-phosphoribosylamino)methylideneamino]imidazole-4-carboxamide isomerase [Deltaproteobacteria bacterium]|nr:1-(5-phosphoribosyl)-5-[(5-phosphoribosylamino)methylideneamino]imidazole-4-carboxamide isomerase [Deltaproteobacteria bacterium]
MLIIPAIDLKNGKCVRLEQGEMRKETVFSHHPPEIARNWEALGAEMLHLVDLDGAFSGAPQNKEVIQEIRQAINIPIQLGGGIRTLKTIDLYLKMGIDRVILGTIAYQHKKFLSEACSIFPSQIVVGIDARDGKVAIKGWAEQTHLSAIDLARRCEKEGVAAIIYTDIKRDGMLTGVNLSATRMVAQTVSIPVIASGGVATLKDIVNIMPLAEDGVMGVITGRALYEGTIDLAEALQVVKKAPFNEQEKQNH